MKKSLIAGFLLVGLSVAGLFGGLVSMTDQADEVYLTETVLIGEKEDAYDVSFQINSYWSDQMQWETCVDIGEENEVDTEFTFHPFGVNYQYDSQSRIFIETSTNFGVSSSGPILDEEDSDDLYYKKVFQDVASRTAPGEKRTETVKLSDYYEYFLLDLEISSVYLRRYYGNKNEGSSCFTELFAVRIPENLEFSATVDKDEDGNVYSIHGNDLDESGMRIVSGGTVLKNGCYVYMYVRDEEGLMPGMSDTGYGIYKLPLTWEDEDMATMHAEQFALVYPVEERILALESDPEEKELFLVFVRDNELMLHRIDAGSMALQQELTLATIEDVHMSGCRYMKVAEDGILIITTDDFVYYLEKQDDSYVLTVSHDLSAYEQLDGILREEYAYDYEDGRLAIVWRDGYQYVSSNSVFVILLEGEEMKFFAHYKNSLDQADENYDYSNKPRPAQPLAIKIGDPNPQ